ncbi:hypothetical protein MAR_022651 [Mya arenaria]|uniref:THD domain-containing protein n=1 Tax=Mya arenaria TaxID=6604 RepID=A0ABY7DQA1_MYAAR|nr:uncharacterized protein LOC128227409 [Mya arenaria]XP_052793872.1 uncharacterized protein LOC128227409 [Mya arenaria]WAQ98278.1 hypothetical protein MAR_022651 [Mya arenaria]
MSTDVKIPMREQDEHGGEQDSKSDPLLEKNPMIHRSMSAESRKSIREDTHKQIYKSAIILFGVLNILLLVLNALAGYYLASEKAPPQPTSRLCVRCQDIKGHPDDVKAWKHIVQENDTCCLDDPKHLNYLVEYYTERWMKARLTNSNKTFQYCKDPTRDEFQARPTIKVMGFSEPQIHPEHHRLHWDQNHPLALVPHPTKIQYLEDDAQIEIKQAGVYHVYSQVHFDHKQNSDNLQPVVFSHMIYMKKAGTSTGDGTIVMRSRETECESEDPRVVGSSYLASSLQLEDGDRLYVKVYTKDDVLAQPQMNFFGAHML